MLFIVETSAINFAIVKMFVVLKTLQQGNRKLIRVGQLKHRIYENKTIKLFNAANRIKYNRTNF
jgi:hypothetical protein